MASIACRMAGDASCNFSAVFIVREVSFDTSPSIFSASCPVLGTNQQCGSTQQHFCQARISEFAGRLHQERRLAQFGSFPPLRVAYGSLIRSSYQLTNLACGPRPPPLQIKTPIVALAEVRFVMSIISVRENGTRAHGTSSGRTLGGV